METRRVALAVVLGGLAVAVLTVGVQGLVAPLLTTDGYQPPNSTAAPGTEPRAEPRRAPPRPSTPTTSTRRWW